MKKFLLPGILAVFLFLPRESQALPLDVPYQILVSTVNAGAVVLSTNTFPSGNPTVNANVANYQWCVDRVIVSSYTAGTTFSMAWSTSALTSNATDYIDVISGSAATQITWNYRTPYCAPVGQTFLKLTSSVATAILSVEGYLWKGWSP